MILTGIVVLVFKVTESQPDVKGGSGQLPFLFFLDRGTGPSV